MSKQVFIVDNTSSRITYNGSWFPHQSAEEQWKDFGPPYRNTAHGTLSPASFSFSFSGSSIEVMGPNDRDNYWECLIDNKKFAGRDDYPFKPNPNLLTFCKGEAFHDGPHILVVNVIAVNDKTFWFDRIQYSPSLNELSTSENAYVENWDSSLRYGSGWIPAKGNANKTNVTGFNFEFEFTGVSIAWYSWFAPDYPRKSTSATYSLDGGSVQKFALKGLADGARLLNNQLVFETPPLPIGQHKLSVAYNGKNIETDTPLTLDYLIVRSGTSTDDFSSSAVSSPGSVSTITSLGVVSTSSSTFSSVASKSDASLPTGTLSEPSQAKTAKVCIIVSCVIVALVFGIILTYLLLRRWQRKELDLARPFPFSHSTPTSSFPLSPGLSTTHRPLGRYSQAVGKRQSLKPHPKSFAR